MKYLTDELSHKVCLPGGEIYEPEWNRQIQKMLDELEKISSRLPKRFLKEFKKKHFHDNIISNIGIEMADMSGKYNVIMRVIDHIDPNVEYILIFHKVENLKSELKLGDYGGAVDWLYCEILLINQKRLSFEVALPDSFLYFEFSKLQYKKLRNSTENRMKPL